MHLTGRTVVVCGMLVPLLILVPILLWKLDLPFISSTSGPQYRVFELFAFCVALTAVLVAAVRLRRSPAKGLEQNLPTILMTLLACYFAFQVTEYRPQSSDWLSYERAAQAILAGDNPYDNTGYLYPPLTASVLAAAHHAVVWGAGVAGISTTPEFGWQGVFYLYQCCQFFLVLAAIALCFRLATMLGAPDAEAAVLIAVLFIFNVPLLRTLNFHQVNLWVFDLIMVAVLLHRRPLVAGLALGVAAHVKVYAAVLLLPFFLMKRFALVFVAVIGMAAIVGAHMEWGAGGGLWRDYLAFARIFPAGTTFRDNSLHSIVHNTLVFINKGFLIEQGVFEMIAFVVMVVVSALVVMYFWRRFIKREQWFQSMLRRNEHLVAVPEREMQWRTLGHLFDALAMALLLSPLVWEHHYILLLPLVISSALMQERRMWFRIGIAAFLTYAIPIFDVFPFSYHRAAGLVMLLAATPPALPAKEHAE